MNFEKISQALAALSSRLERLDVGENQISAYEADFLNSKQELQRLTRETQLLLKSTQEQPDDIGAALFQGEFKVSLYNILLKAGDLVKAWDKFSPVDANNLDKERVLWHSFPELNYLPQEFATEMISELSAKIDAKIEAKESSLPHLNKFYVSLTLLQEQLQISKTKPQAELLKKEISLENTIWDFSPVIQTSESYLDILIRSFLYLDKEPQEWINQLGEIFGVVQSALHLFVTLWNTILPSEKRDVRKLFALDEAGIDYINLQTRISGPHSGDTLIPDLASWEKQLKEVDHGIDLHLAEIGNMERILKAWTEDADEKRGEEAVIIAENGGAKKAKLSIKNLEESLEKNKIELQDRLSIKTQLADLINLSKAIRLANLQQTPDKKLVKPPGLEERNFSSLNYFAGGQGVRLSDTPSLVFSTGSKIADKLTNLKTLFSDTKTTPLTISQEISKLTSVKLALISTTKENISKQPAELLSARDIAATAQANAALQILADDRAKERRESTESKESIKTRGRSNTLLTSIKGGADVVRQFLDDAKDRNSKEIAPEQVVESPAVGTTQRPRSNTILGKGVDSARSAYDKVAGVAGSMTINLPGKKDKHPAVQSIFPQLPMEASPTLASPAGSIVTASSSSSLPVESPASFARANTLPPKLMPKPIKQSSTPAAVESEKPQISAEDAEKRYAVLVSNAQKKPDVHDNSKLSQVINLIKTNDQDFFKWEFLAIGQKPKSSNNIHYILFASDQAVEILGILKKINSIGTTDLFNKGIQQDRIALESIKDKLQSRVNAVAAAEAKEQPGGSVRATSKSDRAQLPTLGGFKKFAQSLGKSEGKKVKEEANKKSSRHAWDVPSTADFANAAAASPSSSSVQASNPAGQTPPQHTMTNNGGDMPQGSPAPSPGGRPPTPPFE
jgi:hypothetical protein